MDAFIFFGCLLGVMWLLGWAWEQKAKREQEDWDMRRDIEED